MMRIPGTVITVGQVAAATASLLVLTACGGGGGGDAPATTAAPTSSTVVGTTTTTRAATTTTAGGGTTTTTATTTTTTVAGTLNLAATTLVVQHSAKCLTVSGTTAGGAATQSTCVPGSAGQSWKITPSGASYVIQSNLSNLCLGIQNASTTPGDPAVQVACNSGPSALWTFTPVPGQTGLPTKFQLKPNHSGQCLDVFGSQQTDGSTVLQFTCNAAIQQNQVWAVTR